MSLSKPCALYSNKIDLVQQGISEKVALAVSFISAFVTGFILAYARCWRLALAMSSILPCIGITGAVMNRFVSKYTQCVPFSPILHALLNQIVGNPSSK